MNAARKEDRSAWHAILGVALILGGLALLASRADWLDLGPIWRWWPLVLIGLGLAKVAFDRREERGGGIWLLAAGVYCGIGVWEPYGLSWATGWPVMIVALGASFLIDGGDWARGCTVGVRRESEPEAERSAVADPLHPASPEDPKARHGR